jgi:hypothetical protein
MTEGKCIRFRKADSLAALGMKRGGDHRRNSLNQHLHNWLHRDLSTPSVACAPTPLKMTEWECIRCCTGSTLALAGLFKTLTIELCGRANSIPHVYAFHVVQQIPRCARNDKRRRSSQKFPESTSLQLAAPGSFDSVGRMRSDSAQDDRFTGIHANALDTNSAACFWTSASSPKPLIHSTSGSRRNHVICLLA